jgi:hypothetical protein
MRVVLTLSLVFLKKLNDAVDTMPAVGCGIDDAFDTTTAVGCGIAGVCSVESMTSIRCMHVWPIMLSFLQAAQVQSCTF